MQRQLFLALLCALVLACSSSSDTTNTTSTGGASMGHGGSMPTVSSSSTGEGGSRPESGTGTGGFPMAGAAIDAPNEQWTWVPFQDAFCANGATTGIGVNLTNKSKRVLVFLMGGGACWDETTCFKQPIAANIETGYGASNFEEEKEHLSGGIFSRADPANPFKDHSLVFVPYCTGDLHGGDNEVVYGTHPVKHVGRKNIEAYLKRLVPTFAGAERLVLFGSSAGGYGALLNFWRVQEAFGKTRVDFVDDSGPPLPSAYSSPVQNQVWQKQWNLSKALPPDCEACKENLAGLFAYYAKTFQGHRGALLSYTNDDVISFFYNISSAQFQEGLEALVKAGFDAPSPLRYFFVSGDKHTLVNSLGATTGGITLSAWLKQMASDDPAWKSEAP